MTTLQQFIHTLSDHLQKNNALQKIIKKFRTDYSLIACIGVEIEFYLSKNIDQLEFQTLLGIAVKKEKGANQFEVDLPPSTNIIEYIEKISSTKSKIQIIAEKLRGNVNFSAKPFASDYGSSMHFHVNFIFPNDLEHCILNIDLMAQSICHYMLDTFLIFMPNEDDYLRLDKNFMAPTNVSFGNNNRTVALRIPDLSPKRLEHRIANPLTDPYLAIFTILNSIFLGLKFPDKINNINKIYGNAFDEQYNLVSCPKSLTEALELFNLEFFIYTQ